MTGGGGRGGCSRLRFARCLLRWLLRWLFHPGAKGNCHFNYAQFKAENVIRAHALEIRSIKEQENLNSLSENSRYHTSNHAMFSVGHAGQTTNFLLFSLDLNAILKKPASLYQFE